MKAASQFAAFAAGSLVSFGVDWAVFSALWWALPENCRARLFVSVAVARCLSLVFNFTCNKYLVFRPEKKGTDPSNSAKEGTDPSIFVGHPENAEKEGTDPSPGVGTGLSFVRYLMLAAAILVGSWALLKAIHALLPAFPLSLAKPVVDLALFFVSFTVQRHFVFAH